MKKSQDKRSIKAHLPKQKKRNNRAITLSWSLCMDAVRLLMFRDIAWKDSQDLRGTSEIYILIAL